MATLLPYARASASYSALTGVSVSASTLRRWTQGEGGRWVEVEEGEAAAAWKPAEVGVSPCTEPQAESEVLSVSLDGVTVNIRGEGWKEVKVATFSRVELAAHPDKRTQPKQREPQRLKAHSYRAGLWDAVTFGRQQWAAAKRRGFMAARLVLSINDGAHWIWSLILTCYPLAVGIIDWWHAMDHLWQVARAAVGQGSAHAAAWVAQQERALWTGKVEQVVTALRALNPDGEEARECVRQNIGYFEYHSERMRYERYRLAGYPLGSGAVEGGGCKHLVGDRLKQAGMRWSRPGAQAILSLRAALFSDRWKDVWNSVPCPT
jgi:hypothetical protein